MHATNDIQSKITGSTLKNVGTLKAYAASDLVQVGTAISAGIIQGQNGNGVQAAVADNQLTNNVGVTISGGTIAANSVEAKAFDGVIEAKTTHLTDLRAEGFDVDGTDAMADVNASQANVSVNKDQVGAEKKDANGEEQGDDGKEVTYFTADGNSGNLIVSGAASIIANTSTQGKVTAGAAAVNQTINNNFTVDITNAKITAETVQAKAESDTLMVGVAAGVAVSTGQQGAANLAGSVGVMQLNNNTKTTIENSEITAQTIVAKAVTKSRLINVAGQVSASKGKVAAGLATATNILNNTTGAYVYGSTIKGKDGNEDTSLTVEADNNSEAYAVAVGVAAQVGQQGAALSGDVAVNKGKNNTEAIVGKRNGTGNTITNVDDININVLGNTTLNAISGGVTASTGNAGLGGAVAYNEVGNGDNDKQNTLAKLTDTVITTDKATTINVNAEYTSHVLAFAVGAAVQTGQTGAAAQGSAATTILHKNVEAAVSNVDIDKHEENKTDRHNAALNVTAQNTSEAITSADVMAISTANFAGGAAVAVTNSDNDTKASITGGNMNLKSGKVQADSNVDIINIGISAAVATGQGGSIAGNVAVNNIKNDTIASIDKANMNATGTIGVLANSKEHIKNYAGALSAAVGQGYAAGGLSTAVNVISGDTKATVTGSTITAEGKDSNNGSSDGITVTKYNKDKKYNATDNATETLTGFVVNADSAHEIDNVVVTGGVAATAEFAVAGTGTVTVNTIKGATEASVTGTDVNKDETGIASDSKANVSVRANDNTEIDSHVGSASIAASANGGVGVGIASDSNVMSRKVTAKIAGDNAKKTVNANKLTVNAFNKHDITTSTTGVAVGAGAYAGVGVAGTISVVKTDAETTAEVENIEGKNNGFTVNADHVNKLVAISNSAALGGAVGGASIGAGVSIVQDGSKTQAALKGSNLDHYQDNAQDSVTAHNDTDLTSSTASGAASISIGAGVSDVITINNIDNTVQTTVGNSNIGATKQAGKITVDATNDLKTEFVAVSAAGGLVGVGMGIGVNTIDTSVVTNVTGGSIKAGTVEITANENRDIDQTAVSAGVGGVAGSATVMVTNIGSQVSDKYGLTSAETVDQNGNATTTETKAKEVDISGAFSKANESAAAQDKLFTNKDDSTGINSNGILGDAGTTGLNMGTGLDSADYKTGVQANKGGDTVVGNKLDVQGVKVNVNNADITASSATIKANAKTDADITVGNAAAGAVSVGSTVGVLDVKRNSGVNITGGNISANNLTVGSDQSGTARVDVYQAAASGANFGLFYSGVKLHGNNDINIKGAQLSGKNGVAITTNDTTTASLQTIGGSFALTENANIFVVDGKNESSSTITVDSEVEGENKKNSEIKAENGDVTITAKHGDGTTKTMTANIIPVSVAGVASGLGFNAIVEDNSITAVDIKDNQQFTAKNNVNINAENNSVNEVTSVAANAALGVAVGATGVQAKGKATSKLTIGSNNTFTGSTVNLGAKANVNNTASITSIGAGFGNFMVNWATTNGGTDVDVNIGDNTYATENVNIKGESVITQDVHAQGFTDGMYTSGTNLAKADANEDVDVVVGGNKSNDNNSVKVEAKGTINQTVDSQGYGGAYFDLSPAAAITKSNIASNTNAKVTGIWAAKTMDVSAVHDNNVTLKTDAIKAAAVGLSGVWSFSDVTNNTGVTLEGATITTDGDFAVKAQNDITYTNEVLGGGYGALVGNAMDAKDNFVLNTNVALKNNSKVTSNNGKIEMSALTGDGVDDVTSKPNANIDKNVTLKSAGLVAGSLAFSKDDVKINNAITVEEGSALATKGNSLNKDANDIKLIAADMLGFTDVATANTQGGAVGAASTDLDAEFDRKNTITINGTVDSNYDATFNAGGNSIMNVTLRSNAYNKTAAPIVANPGLDYNMTQTNTVVIGDTGTDNTVQTARNINLIGDTGNTTIVTEAKSWKWTDGGETGTGSIASTADGTQSKDDKLNNGVEVNGKLLAGKNSKLDIVIDDANKETFDAELQKYVEKHLKDQKEAYEAAKKSYDDYINGDDIKLKDKENALKNAESKKAEAVSVAKTLNDSQNATGGAGDLKTDAENKQKTLQNSANSWFNKIKGTDGNITIDNSDGTKTTIDNVEGFLALDETVIKKLIKEKSTGTDETAKQKDADDFINLKTSYKTAQDKYDAAKNVLNTSANASGLVEFVKGQYVVKDKINQDYNKAKNAYDGVVNSEAYKSKLNDLKTAENNYNYALDNQGDIVKEVNDYIKNKGMDKFVDVKVDDWYKQQNDGKAIDSVELRDYAVGLTNRLNELEKLIQEYTGSSAEASFKTELERIQEELRALGLAHYGVDSKGNTTSEFIVDDSASTVPTVVLKKILVTGGNINVTGGSLKGSGTMKAVGNPTVNITNNSNYYLRVDDITIDGEGGNVKFNDSTVKNGYNGLKVEDSPGKLVGGNNATINIIANGAKANSNSIYTPDIGIFGTIYNPFGKVNINNAHNNIYVAAEVKDNDGNITQQGGSIKGREITLTAGGSITQGYNDGIVNVGGNPHYGVGDDIIKNIQKALIDALGNEKDKLGTYRTAFSSTANLAKFIEKYVKKSDNSSYSSTEATDIANKLMDKGDKEKAGMYASGAIYINAANINVNGTIQSGYAKYKLEVDEGKFKDLPADYSKIPNDDKNFMNDTWLVSKGDSGAVYENGEYVYNVRAWYNPHTQEIITEDIDQSGGGRIHIVGAIASTGGGRLVALDGGAEVTIKNDTAKYLKVGSINVDKVNGMITVVDTTKEGNNATIYTRNDTTSGRATYDTTKGQMYIWTSGTSNQVITTYKAEYDSKWFGLDKKRWEDQVDQLDKVVESSTTIPGLDTAKGDVINSDKISGEYKKFQDGNTEISSSATSGNDYQITYERSGKYKQGTNESGDKLYWTKDKDGNQILTTAKETNGVANEPYYLTDAKGKYIYDVVKSDPSTTRKKKLLGLWGSHVTTTWKETSGVLTSYNFGLKADNDINIEFIGNKDGGTVDINSKNNINLAGDIRANKVSINSEAGSIGYDQKIGQKTIFTDNLKLTAAKDITALQQSVGKALHLQAVAGQNINVKAMAGITSDPTGAANNANLVSGNVFLDNVSAGNDLTLEVEGSVLNATRPDSISQHTVKSANSANQITSTNNVSYKGKLTLKAQGDIGSADDYLGIADDSGTVNVSTTKGNIYLKQEGNNEMKLGQIITNDGDVYLNADGGFIDAIENNSKLSESDQNRKDEWKKQGILSDKSLEEQQKENYKEQLDTLEGQATSDGILGNSYVDNSKSDAAYAKLNEALADMNSKKTALEEAGKNKANNPTDEAVKAAYNEALSAYTEANKQYESAQKTYTEAKAADIEANKSNMANAGSQLITDAKSIVEKVSGEYSKYYEEQNNMYTAQKELNEAISAKNNKVDGADAAYETKLKAYNDAFAKYAQAKKTYEEKKASAINAYVTEKGYVDAEKGKGLQQKTNVSNWLANYEELTHGTEQARLAKYGWTENQLLYAIQDSIINPSAGSVADVNNANIIANNIHLTTAKGNLGRVDDTQKTVISLDDMSKMFNGYNMSDEFMKKMNKLAGARADDVTWGTKNITVERTTPISVKLNSDTGTVSIDAPNSNNIYLIGKDSKLNLDQVISKGDVRLTGQKGIDASTIIGSNISLEGGSGSIGSSTKAVLAGLVGANTNGKINANAAGDIWLTQLTNKPEGVSGDLQKDMVLGSLAGKNITITASGNIVSGNDKVEVDNTTETKGISYINASEKLTLTSSGSVGTADSGLRIKNSGGVVDIDAKNGAYLEAKGDGTLVLGTIVTGTDTTNGNALVVNSEGSLTVGDGGINASVDNAKANVKLTTAKDLTFSGNVRANELTAQSYAGDITQTTTTQDKNIEANKLNVSAIAGNIKLANEYNVIKNINIEGLGGALDLVVRMDDGLDLNLGSYDNALSNNYGGDFKITNNAGGITVKSANTNIYGNIELTAKGDLIIYAADEAKKIKNILATNQNVGENDAMLKPDGDIKLTSQNGSVTSGGMLNANSNGGEGSHADIIISAAKGITVGGETSAKNSIQIKTANGDIKTTGKLDSQVGGVNAETGTGNININNTVNIGVGNVIAKVTEGNVKFNGETTIGIGSIRSEVGKGDVEFNNKTDITIGSIINKVTEGNVKFNGETTVGTGSITNEVGKGNVGFDKKTNVTTGSIKTTVDNGNIDYNAETNVNTGNISTEAKNINHNANMTVTKGNITDKASETINSKDKGKADVKLEAVNGSIDIDAGGDINLAEVIAKKGTADISSENGNIYLRKVNGKDVILVTKDKDKKKDKKIEANDITAGTLTTEGNNIAVGISYDKDVRKDGYVDITFKGIDDNSAIGNINLTINPSDIGKGAVIKKLWANNVKINLSEGSLDIEKLAIENKAEFDVNGMMTTVWGVPPQRDGSDSSYWFDMQGKNPANDLNAWKDEPNDGRWMNLSFSDEKHVQSSNGVLLHLRNYFYAYNQRFSGEDHLLKLLTENKADAYDINYNPEVVHYFRYDLYDLDEVEQQIEQNADPAKIAIEA